MSIGNNFVQEETSSAVLTALGRGKEKRRRVRRRMRMWERRDSVVQRRTMEERES